MATKLKGLGRGLDALLGGDSDAPAPRAAASATTAPATAPIDALSPGKYQPRSHMDPAALEELAASIREQGLMQPILVRPIARDAAGVRYEIIAGERRWRAARLAGLKDVPVTVREVADRAALAMALIENIQREDLNALEEAQGIARLVAEFGLTHDEAAHAVGRSRATVSNLLRLLTLAEPAQRLVAEGALDMGHARALLALDEKRQVEFAKRAAEEGWSVRETERRVNEALSEALSPASAGGNSANPTTSSAGKAAAPRDRDVERLEEELSGSLGTRVEIHADRKGAGRLVIRYTSLDHLESLLARMR